MRSFVSIRTPRGMSFIDVVVGSALTLLIFLALFGLIRASLLISSSAKAKAGATAIAASQMEYIRSLPYNSLGTSGGIPSGAIPQNATTTLNGIDYGMRTFIVYADDAADGLGGSDANGIITDYKRAKVSRPYTLQNRFRTIEMVSNQSPPGVESTVGGGTLRLEVVDSQGAPVSGATVRVVNASTNPTVDVTTFSDITGTVLFSGAATSTEYEVYVSKSGYSSAQTYARDGTNQNPTPGYLTVAEAQTTTGTFTIDLLGTIVVSTFSPPTPGVWSDPFADTSLLASQNSTAVGGGLLSLSGSPGTYAVSGDATSVTISPSGLSGWDELTASLVTPASTVVTVHLVDGAGVLVADAVLPGNSTGFTSFPVDLSGLSTTTYGTLALRANLSSSDVNVSPFVLDWMLSYEVGQAPLPNVSFTLTGGKTIGSMVDGTPIYKTIMATTTGASGTNSLSLEWDLYTLDITGYTVTTSSPASPYELFPGASLLTEHLLTP